MFEFVMKGEARLITRQKATVLRLIAIIILIDYFYFDKVRTRQLFLASPKNIGRIILSYLPNDEMALPTLLSSN